MTAESNKQLAQKIINKDKWWDILSRLIDVLRINIFIVDANGSIILPPEEGRCGGKLLTDPSMGFDLLHHSNDIIKKFEPQGKFLESINRFDLHSYAIPVTIKNQTIAYVIVGPVILNKRLENEEYIQFGKRYGVSESDLVNEINEIRVVSNLMAGSILDLLSEIVKDNIELSLKETEISQMKSTQENLSTGVQQTAKEIYSTVCLDELLVAFLDLALKMTNTECGSIMVMDDEQGDLIIKVSRGLDNDRVQNTRVRLGEGISGSAAKKNASYVIDGQKGDQDIKLFLKRSDIQQSLVMPLSSKNRVFGVLNLHTKKADSKIQDNVDNLQYLSKLISAAF